MSNSQETSVQILKEMRGNEWDSPAFDRYALEAARKIAREWADRLEAAHRRELFEAEASALEIAGYIEASRYKPTSSRSPTSSGRRREEGKEARSED